MALRAEIRRTLQPGEQVRGFGAADTAGPGWRGLAALAPVLPMGSIWSGRVLRRRRVLVLTDRRLMVLPPDRPELDRRSVRWNGQYPLTQAELNVMGRRTVRVGTPDGVFVARLRGVWSGAELSTVCPVTTGAEKAR
jgi:hypothetical protein